MSELKPCPFCGGEAELDEYCGKYVVFCKNASCSWRKTKAEAIEAWNARYERTCETCEQTNNPDSFITHLLNRQCPHYSGTRHYCNIHSCEVCGAKVVGE